MNKVKAIMNAGRWIAFCPKHGVNGAVQAVNYYAENKMRSILWTENNEYICPVCYPGIAVQIVYIEQGVIKKRLDQKSRDKAIAQARKDDKVFKVIFPSNRAEIEKTVGSRPVEMQNWEPGETIKFLKEENKIIDNLLKAGK